jgi:hypothetical protein
MIRMIPIRHTSRLLAAAGVAVLLAGGAARAEQASGNVCMGTLFTEATGGQVGCTANDIKIASATHVSVASCIEGTHFDFTATFEVRLSGGGTKQTRYDTGLYFDINGDPEGDGARGGTCTVAVAGDGEPGFLNLDGDTCGDINSGHNPLFPEITFHDVLCADTDGDGRVNLPNCVSWRQPGSNDLCDEATDAYPGAPSKCNCDDTFNIDIFIEPPDASVSKTAKKACVTFQVVVSNPTASKSLTLTGLSDDLYGNIADATNANLCSTTCDVDPAPTIAPGGNYTCEFAADVNDSSSTQTDTVTATLSTDSGPITRTGSDTILLDLNP